MVGFTGIVFIIALAYCFLETSAHLEFNDRVHLQSHVNGELDLSVASEQEIQFLYFQSHDAEANNKLDGCELIQSLLHYHSEEAGAHGQSTKVFTDSELSMMIDPLMSIADTNQDGFIDYPEFVSGQYPVGL